MGDLNEDRILIVKVAKGGRSLGNDFLPPSSGPYATPATDGDTGYYYAEILKEVNLAITNLATSEILIRSEARCSASWPNGRSRAEPWSPSV